jgi:hypothetical protein
MPFCPKCRTEYRDGFYVCADCGENLTNMLPPAADDEPLHNLPNGKFVFLKTFYGWIDTEIAASLLESNGVTVMRKNSGADGYLKIVTGNPGGGTDLYVPEKLLDTANEILSAKPVASTETEITGNETAEEKEDDNNALFLANISFEFILKVFFVIIMFMLFLYFINFLKIIR